MLTRLFFLRNRTERLKLCFASAKKVREGNDWDWNEKKQTKTKQLSLAAKHKHYILKYIFGSNSLQKNILKAQITAKAAE